MRIGAALSVMVVVIAAVGPTVVACGSDGDGNNNGLVDGDGGVNGDAFVNGQDVDANVNVEKDPFPQWCGPEAGKPQPPLPTGTEQCPSDKNVEGCPCTTVGEKAPCWPGLRKNRNLGSCKDGTATCLAQGELGKVWGKCEGAVLPSGTTGAASCNCFSGGEWKIQNLVPCFVQSNGTDYYATSAACPLEGSGDPAPPKGVPSAVWSKNTVKIDCEGHFKLCFTIRAGDVNAASEGDCKLTTVCTEADYLTKNVEQAFPDLPGWFSDDDACIKKIMDGKKLYFEMTVNGNSFFCDEVGSPSNPLMFNRKPYCDLGVAGCGMAGSGSFP